MKLKIYHNNRCSKSRLGLEALQSNGVEFEIVEYLKTPFTFESLQKLLMKLNMHAQDLVRKNEAVYKEKFKGQQFNEDEWIKILLEYPQLIERPIVESQYKAIIARPTELINDFIK